MVQEILIIYLAVFSEACVCCVHGEQAAMCAWGVEAREEQIQWFVEQFSQRKGACCIERGQWVRFIFSLAVADSSAHCPQ